MVTHVVIMGAATVHLHWMMFTVAAHMPNLSIEARQRSAQLAKVYGEAGKNEGAVARVPPSNRDVIIVRQLQELNFTLPPRPVVYEVRCTVRDGGPINDGKPERCEAATAWALLQECRDAQRPIPNAFTSWVASAEPGQECAIFDGNMVVRGKVNLRE